MAIARPKRRPFSKKEKEIGFNILCNALCIMHHVNSL